MDKKDEIAIIVFVLFVIGILFVVYFVEYKPESERIDSGCYFELKEFYVRTNPATDKLEGQKMVKCIQRHFKNK